MEKLLSRQSERALWTLDTEETRAMEHEDDEPKPPDAIDEYLSRTERNLHDALFPRLVSSPSYSEQLEMLRQVLPYWSWPLEKQHRIDLIVRRAFVLHAVHSYATTNGPVALVRVSQAVASEDVAVAQQLLNCHCTFYQVQRIELVVVHVLPAFPVLPYGSFTLSFEVTCLFATRLGLRGILSLSCNLLGLLDILSIFFLYSPFLFC